MEIECNSRDDSREYRVEKITRERKKESEREVEGERVRELER